LHDNYVLLATYFYSLKYIPIVLRPCDGCDECSLSLLCVQNVLCTWQAASRPAVCHDSANSFRNESVRGPLWLPAVRDCWERKSLANHVLSSTRILLSAQFCQSPYLILHIGVFKARSQNCEKRLLASSCPPVRPFAWNSAPTGRIFMKFDIGVFFEISSRKSRFH
jgi:hypothetical protein